MIIKDDEKFANEYSAWFAKFLHERRYDYVLSPPTWKEIRELLLITGDEWGIEENLCPSQPRITIKMSVIRPYLLAYIAKAFPDSIKIEFQLKS